VFSLGVLQVEAPLEYSLYFSDKLFLSDMIYLCIYTWFHVRKQIPSPLTSVETVLHSHFHISKNNK